ncbi:DUF4271 domain-containing protein [Chondrinema litorale]|uniref:DUF4271 domain-containing protein n=1 Tax=Chondrinema litorale TaxID=2994555 RepID=UPI002542E208|nr:DUF4271 domain-containing protein [Chondrinema litorale]UZR92780.1 DUF4271 domain-containing protein [Chondrinema litorale]
MKYNSLILFFLFFSTSLIAQSITQNAVPLDDEWLIYDWEEKIYIPYIPEVHKDVKALSLYIYLSHYKDKNLAINYESQVDVFINNKLYYSLDNKGGEVQIPVKKITDVGSIEESIFISLHTKNSFNKPPNVIITDVDAQLSGDYHFAEENLQSGIYRFQLPFENTSYLLLILGISSMLLMVKWTDNPLFYLFFPSAFLSFFFEKKLKEETKISVTDIILFVFYSALVVVVVLINIEKSEIVFFQVASALFENFSSIFSVNEKIVSSFFLLLSLFFLKIVLINVAGKLYNLKSEINIHINEYIVVTQFLFTILFLITIIHSFYPHFISESFILNALYYVFLLISILVSFRIYSIISFKKVYLISYFCITEFIPAAIILRLL